MIKYIVKSCPCLEEHTQNCWDSHIPNEISCKDRADCPIKQVVWLVKVDNTICKHIQCPIPTLNAKILQTLQVEEVE